MKRLILISIFLLSACVSSEETIKLRIVGTLAAIPTSKPYPTYTPYPTPMLQSTYTPYPTYTPMPTYTPPKPQVVIVTPTALDIFSYQPTTNLTPPSSNDPLYSPHASGVYLVNIDIGPGIWRSDPTIDTEMCYWTITGKTGDIIKIHVGMAGGTMYISPNAFQVEMSDACGTWTFLKQK